MRAIESEMASIRNLKLKHQGELETKVLNLYQEKQSEIRKLRLDLGKRKRSAGAPGDPSPLEAAQFASITAESSAEELLSMETAQEHGTPQSHTFLLL